MCLVYLVVLIYDYNVCTNGLTYCQRPFNFAAFIIEASFGAWAGWRGYSIISSQNNDSFDAISQIPLCSGRRYALLIVFILFQ